MKPPPFKYVAADSTEHALEQMAEHGDMAKLLAGGQSLIPAMNFRVMQPSVLIDLNRIDDLQFIRVTDEGLSVGAMTRQSAVEKSEEAEDAVPLLAEAMPHVAHPQIRSRGTIGGSLAHADPAAELPVVAIAAGARMKVVGPGGERWIEARDFFQGMFFTAIEPDEMLVEVLFPSKADRVGWSFKETSRRRGDYAMMGVAAVVKLADDGACEEAQLVYLNAGDGPVEAQAATEMLIGERPGESVFTAAANEAAEHAIDPMGNVHATVEFQRHLAKVLTVRALETAFERAEA